MKNKETLEELAEKLQEEIKYGASISDIIDTLTKWQQEQNKKMYSEEDLKTAWEESESNYSGLEFGRNRFYEWLEQFKTNKIMKQNETPNPADFMQLGEKAFEENVHEKLRETLSPNEKQMWISGYLLALTQQNKK